MEVSPTARRGIPIWVVTVCLAAIFFGIRGHELWTPDEPRVGEIARGMSAGSSWLVPQLAGRPFVEKPPLYFWLSVLMVMTLGKAVGVTASLRLLPAICGVLTLLVLYRAARRYLGNPQAVAAVLVLATMYGFFHATHWIVVDPLLMFLTSGSVLFLFEGLDGEKPLLLLAGYLLAGLAFLTKGFVAWAIIGVPGVLLGILYFRTITQRPFLNLAGFLLLLAPVTVWMMAFYLRGGPELWREWFIENQLGRFLGRTDYLGHIRGPIYYLAILPAVVLPWTPVLLGWIIHRRWRSITKFPAAVRNLHLMIIAWAFGGLLILSLAGTKRDIYLFPLLPGFALLITTSLDGLPRWVEIMLKVLCFCLLLPILFFSFGSLAWEEGRLTLQLGFSLPLLVCTAAGLFAIIRYWRNIPVSVCTVTGLFYLAVVLAAFPVIDRAKNYEPATRHIAAAIPAGDRSSVCGWNIDETTRAIFSYYTGLTLIDLRDDGNLADSLRRLQEILDLEDPQYASIVALIKHNRVFPPAGISLDPEQIRAKTKMGINRTLLLITGKHKSENQPESSSDPIPRILPYSRQDRVQQEESALK